MLPLLKKKKQNGFTLIEVMIVVSIIGILVATAVPYFVALQNKTKRVELINALSGVYVVEVAYFATLSEWLPHSCGGGGPPYCDCTQTSDPLEFSRDFTAGGLNFSGSLKFYGICIFFPGLGFTVRGAGNIDLDPALDQGEVTNGNRTVFLTLDDILN